MKIYMDIDSTNIELYGQAHINSLELFNQEIDTVLDILEDMYPEGLSMTTLNDFFAYEQDTIAKWLGYDNWVALYEDRNF